MTFAELRNKIKKQYKVGKTVNMRERDSTGKIKRRFKAKIITFYPHTVCCLVNGNTESFLYYDFHVATAQRRVN